MYRLKTVLAAIWYVCRKNNAFTIHDGFIYLPLTKGSDLRFPDVLKIRLETEK
jgi:hypothetical protein